VLARFWLTDRPVRSNRAGVATSAFPESDRRHIPGADERNGDKGVPDRPASGRLRSWRTSSQKAYRSNSAASDGDLPWFDLRIIRAMQSSARPRQDG
jgi:hypothetical protein